MDNCEGGVSSYIKNSLEELIGFTTTYLCARAFSTLVYLENKYRNRLYVENDLRLKLYRFNPSVECLECLVEPEVIP